MESSVCAILMQIEEHQKNSWIFYMNHCLYFSLQQTHLFSYFLSALADAAWRHFAPCKGQGRGPCWTFPLCLWLAVMTCGSIICCSSFTIQHQRENTTTAVSPSTTNTDPLFCTHWGSHTRMCTSINLIFRQKTGFISETCGMLLIMLIFMSVWCICAVILRGTSAL